MSNLKCPYELKKVLTLSPVLLALAAGPLEASLRKRTLGEIEASISQKAQSHLPASKTIPNRVSEVDLARVRPTSSYYFYQIENEDERELDRLTDEQIKKLYELSQKYKNSPNRGEVWLRLGELYAEKSRRLEYRAQKDYDLRLKAFNDGKVRDKPKLIRRGVEENLKKAVELYSWFTRDFPEDEKMDQALFFLGYSHMQLNQGDRATRAYSELGKKFPKSAYVFEAYFALGEYFFEREEWKKALDEYNKIISRRSSRLYDFALFKAAWCHHSMGQSQQALKSLEQVISRGDARAEAAKLEGRAEINTIRLSSEARRDLVLFYAATGEFKKAESYFSRWLTTDKDVFNALETLAYRYAVGGNREGARHLFAYLLEKDSSSSKAFDYKYQIVQTYANSGQDKKYLSEITDWISSFGPASSWASRHSSNASLMETVRTLPESILRNYTLARHQNAQNTKLAKVQGEAADGYRTYLENFKEGGKVPEMHFFYAELLYDMGRFTEAAVHYNWIINNDPGSPYLEKAITNNLLTLEKALPSDKKVRENVGSETGEQPFAPEFQQFLTAAQQYLKKYPSGDKHLEVRLRMARTYAIHNRWEPAAKICREIIKLDPSSKSAEVAADLLLDIYETKKDYAGLSVAAEEIMSHPQLKSTKVGQDAKALLERSTFKAALDLEKEQKYVDSARAFEAFAKANPKGELASKAYFNAAVNFEKGGDTNQALKLHQQVISSASTKDGEIKGQSLRILANIARNSGRMREAAQGYLRLAKEFPKSKEAADSAYNAAAIFAGYNEMDSARAAMNVYIQLSGPTQQAQAVFELAEAYRIKKNPGEAAGLYRRYITMSGAKKELQLTAHYELAQIAAAQSSLSEQEAQDRKVVDLGKSLGRDGANPVGLVAGARVRLARKILQEVVAQKIPADPKKQAGVVQDKLKTLNRLTQEVAEIVKINHGPSIVAALSLAGEGYEHMFQAVQQAPVPRGLTEQELAEYRAGIDGIARPFLQQALDNYRLAWSRALQLEAYGEATWRARSTLRRLAPAEVAWRGEVLPQSRNMDWMGL